MNPMEKDLRNALAREEPPADFADRVLEALPSRSATVVIAPPRPRYSARWLAAAAAVSIASGALWYGVARQGAEVDIVGGVTTTGVPGPKQPIFDGGVDRPVSKPAPKPKVTDAGDDSRPARPHGARRVIRRIPGPAATASREQDAQAYLAARQLRLALFITNEKLRVAQRNVNDRSELPTG